MNGVVDKLILLPPALVLALVFLVPALEASAFIGFVFPGEIAVLLGGVLAQQGKVPLWLVFVLGSAGSIVGDSIGYEVGRRHGDRLLRRLPRWLVKPEHLERGKDLLRRRGGVAVFLGLFTAVLRVMIHGLAGTSRLPYRSVVFNVAGAIAWTIETALSGTSVPTSASAGPAASSAAGTSAPESSAWPSPLSMYAAAPTDPPTLSHQRHSDLRARFSERLNGSGSLARRHLC